jgi:hypothetical protein
LVFTTATVAADGWLSVALLGFACLLSVGAVTYVCIKEDSKANFYAVTLGVPLLTWALLFVLFAFAWIGGWVFDYNHPLARLLVSFVGIPFIIQLTLKVCEHVVTEKTVHKLAA